MKAVAAAALGLLLALAPSFAQTKTDGDGLPAVGVGVDSRGNAALDPTLNVKEQLAAAMKRQDDMRDLTNQYIKAILDGEIKIATLRADHAKEVRALESERQQQRADHAKEVRLLEADRLKAIREVDVQNTAITAAQQLAAVQTLAATATSTADTTRANLATTAIAIQTQTDRIVAGIVDRIAVLEKSSYTGLGRQTVADPQMVLLTEAVAKLAAAQNTGQGKSEGIGSTVAMVVSAAFLVIAIITVLFKARTPHTV